GMRLLELSARGSELSAYHIEAAIASVHSQVKNVEETNWEYIVSLYDTLMTLRPSPIVALNRAIAVGHHEGPDRGIEEIAAIADSERLAGYPFYFAALGEFELRRRQPEAAQSHFQTAMSRARNPAERRFLQQRIDACAGGKLSIA